MEAADGKVRSFEEIKADLKRGVAERAENPTPRGAQRMTQPGDQNELLRKQQEAYGRLRTSEPKPEGKS